MSDPRYVMELPFTRHRHLKRGTTYRALGYARVQASAPIVEDSLVMVYLEEGPPGGLYVRPQAEFNDGRFEELPTTTMFRPGELLYRDAICKGTWSLGTACGRCSRCIETLPVASETIRHLKRLARNARRPTNHPDPNAPLLPRLQRPPYRRRRVRHQTSPY